jgi:hypothetical protein
MNNEVPWYVSLIVAFLPFFMFFIAAIWHGRQIRKCLTTLDGRSLAQVFDNIAQEVRRFNNDREKIQKRGAL